MSENTPDSTSRWSTPDDADAQDARGAAPSDAETTRLPSADAVAGATREMPVAPQTPTPGGQAPSAASDATDPRSVWTQRPVQTPTAGGQIPAPSAQAPTAQGSAPFGAPASQPRSTQTYRAPGYQAPTGSQAYGAPAFGGAAASSSSIPQPNGGQTPGAGGSWMPGTPSQTAPAQGTGTSRKGGAALITKKGPSWLALLLAMLLTAALTLSGAWAMLQTRSTAVPSASSSTSSSAKSTTVTPVTSTGDSPDWKAVAKAVSPAVVTITVTSSSSSDVGSGVVYNSSGDIVTNYHVISSALDGQGKISVTLADGRIYEAEIIGHDQTTDLAVIRLKNAPSDLTVATFGSSSDLAVGQEVMAIGAPLGLSNTVTTGIISALNRPVEVSTDESQSQQTDPNDPFGQLPQLQNQQQTSTSASVITNAIQVDASINPGNSGGPLFDSTGKVIGINSSIASNSSSSDTAGSIGLGFAIPVDLVTSVVDQLIASGTVDHGVLGVSVTTGEGTVDGSSVAGAEVAEVTNGGGADAAGLKKGDVIVAVNGETVSSSKQLTGYIRRYKGGDTVTVTYIRDGKKYDVNATLTSQQG